MSLELAINNALSGLNVSQRALSVVAQNIANANTEGYTRKSIEQSAIYIGREQVGSGVRIDDVVRKVDTYLQRSTRIQTSATANTNAVDDYMERIQILLGQPGDSNTLDEYMENFINDLQRLADTPERVSFRESAVDSGVILAREIAGTAAELEDLRYQADNDIAESVGRLNTLLADLDQINVAIVNAGVLGNPISGLQDEQDKIINEITSILDVDVLVQPTNEVYLYAANGLSLLDESAYELEYRQFNSIEALVNGETLSPVHIYRLNDEGRRIQPPEELISGGTSSQVKSEIAQGSMRAQLDLRDKLIPDILAQLDELATVLRDSFNALHNNGSSYPGTDVLTGTREVSASDISDWSGNVRIAVLDKNGEPIPSPFQDELHTGVRALNLNLSTLDDGTGDGQPSVQAIIDEINNHFNPPTTKVSVGNLNNIQLTTVTDKLPNGSPSTLEFDFDLENISDAAANFFVTDVVIRDNTGANVTNTVTTTRPTNSITQYNTTAGSNVVTIYSTAHNFTEGQVIFIESPAGAIDGIPATDFGQFFTVSNVTTNSFQITVGTNAAAGGVTLPSANNEVIIPKYDTIAAGDKRRTNDNGTITADLALAPNALYYDVEVSVSVLSEDENGVAGIKSEIITYRIPNTSSNLRNDRFDHTAISGLSGTRTVPSDNRPFLRAILVDENGVELPKYNGDYGDQTGYLKLVASDPSYSIAIDELNSKQLGITSTTPRTAGTNRGFSHYFELNNFFASNEPNATGDTTKNSAINLRVEDRLLEDANLISLSTLERTSQPTAANAKPLYTYQRNAGANETIQKLAGLGTAIVNFDEAGGLAPSRETLNGYVGQILAFQASNAATMEVTAKDNRILLEGFTQRMDSVTGVNVDEELANTIIYQNAYTASARVISVANEMFDALLESV